MNHESRIPVVGMPSGWGGHAPGPGRALWVKYYEVLANSWKIGKFLAAGGVLFVRAFCSSKPSVSSVSSVPSVPSVLGVAGRDERAVCNLV